MSALNNSKLVYILRIYTALGVYSASIGATEKIDIEDMQKRQETVYIVLAITYRLLKYIH
jgi:hypothetical protein